jgi:SET domain-containing protein
MEENIADKLIKDLEENIYCRLKPSTVSGVGIFAIRDIPKGTDPFKNFLHSKFVEVDPKLVYENEKIDPAVKELVSDMLVIVDGKLSLPDEGLNAMNISFFLNHSPYGGNVIAQNEGEVFIAVRDIKKGEELLVDYKTYAENPNVDNA